MKKVVKWSLIVVLLITLIIFGSQLGLYINLILGNDVLISLESDKTYMSLDGNDTVEFKASVKTNPFCMATCDYKFTDISQGKVIDSNNFTIRPGLGFSKKFEILDPEGRGQKLYDFTMQCKGYENLLCHTSGKFTERNILITADYDYSPSEYLTINRLKQDIPALGKKLSILNSDYYYYDALMKELGLNGSNKDIVTLNKEYYALENLWNTFDFEAIDNKLFDLVSKYNEIKKSIDVVSAEKKLKEKNNLYNSLIKLRKKIIFNDVYDEKYAKELNSVVEKFNGAISFIESNKTFKQKNASIFAVDRDLNKINETKYLLKLENVRNKIDLICNNSCNLTFVNHCSYVNDFLLLNFTNNSIKPCTKFVIKKPLKINYTPINISREKFNIKIKLNPIPNTCCVNGKCKECCTECNNTPILILHGHAFNKDIAAEYTFDAFTTMRKELAKYYVDAGMVSLYTKEDVPYGIWGKSVPYIIKGSYYYDVFKEPESLRVVQTNSENIDTYAIRLKELLENVEYRTGEPKVNIIAHSMGGLVVRRYMQIFGSDKINKLILIGTPNKGIEGEVLSSCGWFGEKLECRDMDENSLFMNKLNREKIPPIKIYNIVGIGCDMDLGTGDGVVLKQNAELVNNYYINGTCSGLEVLHTKMLSNKEVINKVIDILKN